MFNLSLETIAAKKILEASSEGEVIPYAVLQEAIGMNPQTDGYHYIKAARKIVEKEQQCVFQVMRDVGIKRCEPKEVVDRGGKDIRSVRKSLRSAVARQTTLVPVEKQTALSAEDRLKFNARLSMMGGLMLAMRPSVFKRMSEAIEKKGASLPPADSLRLFAARREKRD